MDSFKIFFIQIPLIWTFPIIENELSFVKFCWSPHSSFIENLTHSLKSKFLFYYFHFFKSFFLNTFFRFFKSCKYHLSLLLLYERYYRAGVAAVFWSSWSETFKIHFNRYLYSLRYQIGVTLTPLQCRSRRLILVFAITCSFLRFLYFLKCRRLIKCYRWNWIFFFIVYIGYFLFYIA